MTDLAVSFLGQAQTYLRFEYLPKIERCLDVLPEDDVWWRPNAASNSVGNLLLHLAGNIRQWIVSGVGGGPDTRRRDEEFAAEGPISTDALLDDLRAAIDEVNDVLAALPPDELLAMRTIKGIEVSVLGAILHVVEHFAMHVGQIIYLTKLRTGAELRFDELTADGRMQRGWLGPAGR